MNTVFMLLAIYNKSRLSFSEVCDAIGMSTKTGYNKRSAQSFPVPIAGIPLPADVRDVADYLDALWAEAKKALLKRTASASSY